MRKLTLTFLLLFAGMYTWSKEYHYAYTDNCRKAYMQYIALKPDSGKAYLKKELLDDPYNLMATYISDYGDCLLLLFNGDRQDYDQLKLHQSGRLSLIERGDKHDPWYRLCRAGIYMHWAFAHLRFNENLKAAVNFRRSFLLLKENKKMFPHFAYNDIFLGMEEATVGAIPDNYRWIAALLGMRGDVRQGTARVKAFLDTHHIDDLLYAEAMVYYAYMNYFLLSDKEEAWKIVNRPDFNTKDNLLFSFVKANIAINYRKADAAIGVLQQAQQYQRYEKYPVLDYEYGYALLHQLRTEAIEKFQHFLDRYKGRIFVQDAWQKMAFSYYLEGNMKQAEYCRSRILDNTDVMTDADRQAIRFAKRTDWPDITLLKSQLLIDGGYYHEALNVLARKTPADYAKPAFKLEYYFRLARVNDELDNDAKAIRYYNTAIEQGKDMQEQYAARSALQLGFLYEKRSDSNKALAMYRLALSMKDHDYKNAIDQQAKAGINRLTR